MSAGHDYLNGFDGMNGDFRRRLTVVTAINLAMFFIAFSAGGLAGSQALQADALDFAACGATSALSLWAIGRPPRARTGAGLIKGAALLAMGMWVAATTLYQFFVLEVPEAQVMGLIGFLALAANLLSAYLLFAPKDGDANIRSMWLRPRNDAIGNVAVMIAAVLVGVLNSAAPDLIVAGVIAALFLSSSYQVLRQSWAEWNAARGQSQGRNQDEHEGHEH